LKRMPKGKSKELEIVLGEQNGESYGGKPVARIERELSGRCNSWHTQRQDDFFETCQQNSYC